MLGGAFHWQCVSSPEQGKSTIFVKSPPAEASIFRQSVTNMKIVKTVKYEYDKEISTECELCNEKDLPVHFMRCAALRASPQVKKLFATLKSEISKTNTKT